MGKLKESYISFRSDDVYFRKINELADKLGVSRSECIRLMLDQGIEQYLGKRSPALVVDDVKFNLLIEKGFSLFLKNFGAFSTSPKLMAKFQKFIKVVTSKVAPKGAVQADSIEITEADVGRWIDECVKNDATFETKDVNPQAEKVKKAILTTIRRLKGRVD
jgi:hypothetical protein